VEQTAFSGIEAPCTPSEVTTDANSGAPWSEMDIRDLTNEITRGRTVAQTASFLCRDVPEVRKKMKELGLLAAKSRTSSKPS
jgi:hypothetical protein